MFAGGELGMLNALEAGIGRQANTRGETTVLSRVIR